MDIVLGGATDSETSLDNIQPTINEMAETSETQSGVIKKMRAAGRTSPREFRDVV